MPGLILKLRPHEQLMINGVIIENGGRKTSLQVKTRDAKILRLRNALDAGDATTPLKRAYYCAQMAVAGHLSGDEAAAAIAETVKKSGAVHASPLGDTITEALKTRDFYAVMRKLGEAIAADRPDAVKTAAE